MEEAEGDFAEVVHNASLAVIRQWAITLLILPPSFTSKHSWVQSKIKSNPLHQSNPQ